jgi:hypothetical protein
VRARARWSGRRHEYPSVRRTPSRDRARGG